VAGTSAGETRRGGAAGVALVALAGALLGAALAAAALVRVQVPLLDVGGRVGLVGRGLLLGALAGLAVGAPGAALSRATGRRWAGRVAGALLGLGLMLRVGLAARAPAPPWPALGARAAYPGLAARRASPAAPNLVLVTIDTLRRDHLELYGYQRATAPYLAALAAEATVFEVAIAQAPETLRSLSSLMTGLHPQALDAEFEARGARGAFVGTAFHTLAERLSAGGYDTAAFVSNVYLRQQNGFAQGFAHFDQRSGMFWAGAAGRGRRAEHVVEPAQAWLERARPPFFLWVHVMDPHHPYEAAEAGPWERGGSPHAATWGALTLDAYTRRLKDMRAGARVAAAGELDYLVGRYDAEIRHTDAQIAHLLATLDARGYDARNTTLVVTADHGEEFGDHGGMLHGHTLFDELIRVPLLVRGPGVIGGRRIASQVQLVDLSATLLDLAGVLEVDRDGAAPELDGRTLRGALAGGEVGVRPALSFRDTHYVACRTADWKLVSAFAPYELEPPSWLPWDGLPALAALGFGRAHRPHVGLWRLDTDPGERNNLARTRVATMRALYATLHEHRIAHPPRAVVSAEAPRLDRKGHEALRALGYVE
jgi:arylsulfatase A-like enzyme